MPTKTLKFYATSVVSQKYGEQLFSLCSNLAEVFQKHPYDMFALEEKQDQTQVRVAGYNFVTGKLEETQIVKTIPRKLHKTLWFKVDDMNEMLIDAKENIKSADELAKKEIKIKAEQLLGLEILSSVYMLAILNMILMGDGSSNILNKNSLTDFDGNYGYDNKKAKFPADAFVLNPPYSANGNGMTFVKKALSMMNKGYAAIIIQNSAGSGKATDYNKEILKKNTLIASIKMPIDLFIGKSSVQTNIYVFKVNEKHDKNVMVKFIDFSNDDYTRTNRKKSSNNLKDTNNAKKRYQELVNLVHYGKSYLKIFTEKEYYENTIDPKNGADWNQTAPIDTKPTINDFNLIPGNSISAFTHLNKVFYQEEPFYSKQGSNVYTLRNSFLNKQQTKFIVSVINSVIGKIEYGKNTASRLKDYKIQLPVKNGKINFDFMEKFIAKLEAYLLTTGLKNYTLTNLEKKVLLDFKNNKIKWGEFKLENLFGKSTRGKRLKSTDRILGNLPFVTAGETNEGISAYIANNVNVFSKNTITIDMFGSAKYRNYQYGGDDHVAIVHTEKLPKLVSVFVTSAIHKSSYNGQFHYGRNFYAKDADALVIFLPTKNKKPDYEFMEIIISAIQKLVIKDVVLYSNKKINATKSLVNNSF